MLRKRVNLVLATIGMAAAVCGFPVALAAAVTSGDVRAAPPGTGAGPGGRATVAAVARSAPAGRAGPQILFPVPTQGPPRQFPLPGPTPSPTPPPRRQSPPPPPPPPAPVVTRPAPPPKAAPVVPKPVVTPKPTPKPTPPRPPAPPPPPPLPLPAAPYHAVPPHRLNTELVVFVVAIVPVSLARVRR